jgi:hypothetical protein
LITANQFVDDMLGRIFNNNDDTQQQFLNYLESGSLPDLQGLTDRLSQGKVSNAVTAYTMKNEFEQVIDQESSPPQSVS